MKYDNSDLQSQLQFMQERISDLENLLDRQERFYNGNYSYDTQPVKIVKFTYNTLNYNQTLLGDSYGLASVIRRFGRWVNNDPKLTLAYGFYEKVQVYNPNLQLISGWRGFSYRSRYVAARMPDGEYFVVKPLDNSCRITKYNMTGSLQNNINGMREWDDASAAGYIGYEYYFDNIDGILKLQQIDDVVNDYYNPTKRQMFQGNFYNEQYAIPHAVYLGSVYFFDYEPDTGYEGTYW
jgi:hypothetical protein